MDISSIKERKRKKEKKKGEKKIRREKKRKMKSERWKEKQVWGKDNCFPKMVHCPSPRGNSVLASHIIKKAPMATLRYRN